MLKVQGNAHILGIKYGYFITFAHRFFEQKYHILA